MSDEEDVEREFYSESECQPFIDRIQVISEDLAGDPENLAPWMFALAIELGNLIAYSADGDKKTILQNMESIFQTIHNSAEARAPKYQQLAVLNDAKIEGEPN